MTQYPPSVLIANRGEIARRIIKTARRLGVETVAVYHPVDAELPFVREADRAICLEGGKPLETYLDGARIIETALATGAAAVHPGYGFLAENAQFARAVVDAGLLWIGPAPEVIEVMGDKVRARHAVAAADVPVSGGTADGLSSVDDAVTQARSIGFPVMLKAAAGGGGIGMVVAQDAEQLRKMFAGTQSMAERSFGSGKVFLEKYVASARHVEVQVLGLSDGRVIALGERDCSVQRRHQKVAEECPAPHLDEMVRAQISDAAVRAAEAVGYENAGTVEFLLDTSTGEFVFLEMNTRIQVEHPVTELTYDIDLVEQQLSIAATGRTTADLNVSPRGHSIEFRICAEDPVRFFPAPGTIEKWQPPSGPGIRVDSGYGPDQIVTSHFDPLLAKLCVTAPNRAEAVMSAEQALDAFEVTGIVTNLPFLRKLVRSEEFASGRYDTSIVATIASRENSKVQAGV
ncbi:acetyl-CoA carboxylase biotin carboxylase subunit [Nocardia australiensis]|uniref:acetyl-CoA carboxylase biotin carboxylase subunit n=1 Tax=Nocardia australiensis TaxID=2887191 RepID=UPI001D14583D|nr:biotin carboxylase N-terminal domain-containing protein [Nocardia australiensis]